MQKEKEKKMSRRCKQTFFKSDEDIRARKFTLLSFFDNNKATFSNIKKKKKYNGYGVIHGI